MRKSFLVVLVVFVCLSTLMDLSSGWRRRRRSCHRQDCVLYGWTDYGSCSKTCGWGYVNQRRNIKTKSSCGGRQCPSASSPQRKGTHSCYSRCCPVNCLWTHGNLTVRATVVVCHNKPDGCVLHKTQVVEEHRARVDRTIREAVLLECKFHPFLLY